MTFSGYPAGKWQSWDLNAGLSEADSAVSPDTCCLVKDPHPGVSWLSRLVSGSLRLSLTLSPGPCLPPQEHFNYYSLDTALGHLVFSLKYDVIGDQEHLRLLLR